MNTLTKSLMSGVAAIALLTVPAIAQSQAQLETDQVETDVETSLDAAGENIKDAGDATADAAGDAMQATEDAAENVKAETAEAMDQTGQTIEGAANEVDQEVDEIGTDLANDSTMDTDTKAAFAGYTVADLVGKNVLSDQGNDVGEIDAVVDMNGEVVAVVGVGGFLGLGEHDVAIGLDKINVLDDDTLQLVGYTEEELETMPEFDAEMATELEAEAKLYDDM